MGIKYQKPSLLFIFILKPFFKNKITIFRIVKAVYNEVLKHKQFN